MMKKFWKVAVVATLMTVVLGAAPAAAQASELMLQGSSAAGGSSTLIRGRLNGNTPFSVTGRFNDWVVVFDNQGWPVFVEDVRGLATGPYNRTRPVERLPSGQTRVFVQMVATPAYLNGGWIEIWSGPNAATLDRDPIVLAP
jgi:hypothetical protein